MPNYPDNKYKDEPEEHDLNFHDVTLGSDGGGALGGSASSKAPSRSASNMGSARKWYKRPVVWGSAACLLIFGVVLAIVFTVGGKGGGGQMKVGAVLPPPEVPQTELERNRNDLAAILVDMYKARGMDSSSLTNPDTFQGRALEYVAGSSLYTQLTSDKNVERYAIGVFYLSTFRQPHLLNAVAEKWERQGNWLTKNDLCLWEGIECNGEEHVVGIVLPNNRMSGTLPLEMSLLENLAKMDFSSNLIYMDTDNHGLWSILPTLRELIMDDNYFISETGIPVEFSGLTKIERISLSFNLLQGVFDKQVFSSMTSLVHFEAESNYIGGSLPDSLLALPSLTYIYLRRNSLEFSLSDVLKEGNLPSLFALWLDGNTITGKIPTSIGQFPGIASFSITDAQLTGPLPTEMGLLTDLQRVWLYDNQLNGPIPSQAAAAWTKLEVFEIYNNNFIGVMPQPICSAITSSTYELKSLYADCAEITCECCTECN